MGLLRIFSIIFVGIDGGFKWIHENLRCSPRPPELAQRLMHVQERAAALETCHMRQICLAEALDYPSKLVSDLSARYIRYHNVSYIYIYTHYVAI